jgi:hypothetical protein
MNPSYSIVELTNRPFVVNGRPFNGTGVGYNLLATPGQARLSGSERFTLASGDVFTELALTPNASYFNPLKNPTAI